MTVASRDATKAKQRINRRDTNYYYLKCQVGRKQTRNLAVMNRSPRSFASNVKV